MKNDKPNKSVDNRNPDGTFGVGNNANPNGRPKEKTIKERVLEWLEDHPNDMASFVDHFVKKNRDLAWQMLEGKPKQDVGIKAEININQLLNELTDPNTKEESK